MTEIDLKCPWPHTCICGPEAMRGDCLQRASKLAREAKARPDGAPRDYPICTHEDEDDEHEADGITLRTILLWLAIIAIAGVTGGAIGWAIVQMVTVMAQVLAALVVGL